MTPAPFSRPHKYHAVRTQVDGVWFASKAEALHYAKLKLLQSSQVETAPAHKPLWFCLQPTFVLSDGVTYKPDFIVAYADGHIEIQDVKGFVTAEYRIKSKLMKARYGIVVQQIT